MKNCKIETGTKLSSEPMQTCSHLDLWNIYHNAIWLQIKFFNIKRAYM